ncbi:MAG: response regulator [Lachnospiraceae bacterium]|nr:response regulator [Lachnospiraceae bacterium]
MTEKIKESEREKAALSGRVYEGNERYRKMKALYPATIVFCVIALLTLMGYTIFSFFQMTISNRRALGESALRQQSQQVEDFLTRSMDTLSITAATLNLMMERGDSQEELLEYLVNETEFYQAEIDASYTAVYGWIGGEYLDGLLWEPGEDYVPVERDWYLAALAGEGEPVITEPYFDVMTEQVIISVCCLLNDGVSVASLDVSLDSLDTVTANINLDDCGYGFIVSGDGLVLAHTDSGEKGKDYSEDEEMAGILEQISANPGETFTAEIDGVSCLVFSDEVGSSWYTVMIIQTSDLYSGVIAISARCLLLLLFVLGAIIVFCTISQRNIRAYNEEVMEGYRRLDDLYEATLEVVSKTIDAKDQYTEGHSVRVARYSREIARRMGKNEEEQAEIYNAGLVHDVGKIRVPGEIINKPGKLTDEEYDMIKLHPGAGYHILKGITEFPAYSMAAKYHHERYDGKGYPNGLSGESIPEVSRIIGVADAYDAMASDRSYRKALPQETVRSEIEKGKGTQFDPAIADIMLQMIDEDTEYQMRQEENETRRILVVDDDPALTEMVRRIFEDEPLYQVEAVSTGQEALTLLKPDDREYHVIALNVALPDGSGFELLTEIQKVSRAPVILMTEDKEKEIIEKVHRSGAADYVTKPVSAAAFMEIIYHVLQD